MKDSHLTVRLPAALVRALARRAKDTDIARSHLVREALTAYLSGAAAKAPLRRELTANELATHWRQLPRLSPNEAESFGNDVAAAKASLPAPSSWA